MPTCSVGVCKNYSENTKEIIYHTFPKDQNLCALWVKRCNRTDIIINTKHARVCSDHFSDDSYKDDMKYRMLGLPERRFLKGDAVPSRNLGTDDSSNEGAKRKLKKSKGEGPNQKKSAPSVSQEEDEEIQSPIEAHFLEDMEQSIKEEPRDSGDEQEEDPLQSTAVKEEEDAVPELFVKEDNEDATKQFFDRMANTAKSFHPRILSELKKRICALVMDAEVENEKLKSSTVTKNKLLLSPGDPTAGPSSRPSPVYESVSVPESQFVAIKEELQIDDYYYAE